MVGTAAGLHADEAGLSIGEVLEELGALQRSTHDLSGLGIDVVDLEDVLGDIDANRCGLHGCNPGLATGSAIFFLRFDSVTPSAR
jgi:hypothetical protein